MELEQIRRSGAWRSMGLKDDEYGKIVEILRREPNWTELGMFAVLWSEHCAYKHSRRSLGRLPTRGERILVGPGENAGVVDIDPDFPLAVAFKVESHNHPCAIEPYQGAATGVGGILRDILAMGARPIAFLDSLRFGPLDDPKVRYLFAGVVAGIAGYGNCVGVPTVGGEVYFEEPYRQNPLCNVMCVGLVDKERLVRGIASGVGNTVMLLGAYTGRDGIHGATFASDELSDESASRRPSIQVGDPFTEKLLIECCLELVETGRVVGIQDMGAAGITSSASEMAGRAGTGMELDVDRVPLRERGMTPYEIMLSESQERMLAVVLPEMEDEVKRLCRKWGLGCAPIGKVTGDGLFRVTKSGQTVAEIPVEVLTRSAPVYCPAQEEPCWLKDVQSFSPEELPPAEEGLGEVLLRLLSSPNIASKEWIYHQYDHQVRTDTVVLPGSDAAVMRIKGAGAAIALSIDGNGRYCHLDPFWGAAIAVAEAARNVTCSGARPVAITNCLNFGNPDKPDVFWQFDQAIDGLAAACQALGTPVTGGNVSFYNESGPVKVYPTPVVGMVGVLEDLDKRCTAAFRQAGDAIALLGETGDDLGGSEYLYVIHGRVAGRPPRLDLDAERRLQEACLSAIRHSLLRSAHDCSEGGLAVAVAESCIQGGLGATVFVSGRRSTGPPGASDGELRDDALLFGESQSRVVVSLAPAKLGELAECCSNQGVPLALMGLVGGERLRILRVQEPLDSLGAIANESHGGSRELLNLHLDDLGRGWRSSIREKMGGSPDARAS